MLFCGPLPMNMEQQFHVDGLNRYYIPTRRSETDTDWISAHYDLVYGDFAEFPIQVHQGCAKSLGLSVHSNFGSGRPGLPW